MKRRGINKKTVGSSLTRKRKRRITVLVIALVIAAALLAASAYRIISIRELRAEMEGFLAQTIDSIDSGGFRAARYDAMEALSLAEKLRDAEYTDEIIAHIRLIETVIRGNAFFDSGSYQAARDTFSLAAGYAAELGGIGLGYIEEMLDAAEGYISFYTIIDHADRLLDQDDFEAALSLYEKAEQAASALSFTRGKELAITGVNEAKERIDMAKRALADELLILGDRNIISRDFDKSIAYYQSALEIYRELDDLPGVASAEARLAMARRRLEEKELEEAKASEGGSQDGPSGDLTDAPQENDTPGSGDEIMTPDTNYEFNRKLSFDLSTLVEDQNRSPANLVRMGTTNNRNEGWYNGCGWIATYNALILLGGARHPADIVRDFEIRGTVLGGVFGTYPNAIERFLKDSGYDVRHTLFPQASINIDNAIKAAGIGILGYTHTKAAHYTVVEYRKEDDRFIVHNDGFAQARSAQLGMDNGSKAGAVIDSVLDFIHDTPDILFSFSLITITRAEGGQRATR